MNDCYYIPSDYVYLQQINTGDWFFTNNGCPWIKSLHKKLNERESVNVDKSETIFNPVIAVYRALRVHPGDFVLLPEGRCLWKPGGFRAWKIDGKIRTYTRGPMVRIDELPLDSLCFVADRLCRRSAMGYTPIDEFTPVLYHCLNESLVQPAIEVTDDSFETWANLYLGNFFTKVINASAQNTDQEMLASFRAVEKQLGKEPLDLTKFLGIVKPTIKLAGLEVFLEPVKAIFKAETAMPDDIFDGSYDILDVEADPIAIGSPLESPEFKKQVMRAMTTCLARGWTSVASLYIAHCFKVPQRDLEQWLDNNPEFICKRGKTPGVFYYSMAKKEGVFEIGSDDFVTQLTQILREDAKPWKGPAFLSQQLGCEEAKFIAWADVSPILIRKPSEKHADKFYYALRDRVGGEVPAPKEEATEVVETPAVPTETPPPPVEKKPKESKKQKKKSAALLSSITDEERFAFAQLHLVCGNLLTIMDFYANRLALRHSHAFGHLTRSQKELRAAVALLQAGIKVEDKRLPDLDQL